MAYTFEEEGEEEEEDDEEEVEEDEDGNSLMTCDVPGNMNSVGLTKEKCILKGGGVLNANVQRSADPMQLRRTMLKGKS
jgi:hypothetical protein